MTLILHMIEKNAFLNGRYDLITIKNVQRISLLFQLAATTNHNPIYTSCS